MSGIDYHRLRRHQTFGKDPDLTRVMDEARAAGDLPEGLYRPRMAGQHVYGEAYIGHPTLDMSPIAADGTYVLWQNVPYEWGLHMDDRASDHARAKRALRELIEMEAAFLKKYVPGFERSWIANVGRFVGVRDGRHPRGDYVFNLKDVRAGATHRDAVTRPMTKTFYWGGHQKYTFEVPYRCFLPRGIDNMLLTGASLSFDYDTLFMVMRNFPWCTQTGRAMHRQEDQAEGIRIPGTVFLMDTRWRVANEKIAVFRPVGDPVGCCRRTRTIFRDNIRRQNHNALHREQHRRRLRPLRAGHRPAPAEAYSRFTDHSAQEHGGRGKLACGELHG
jgi:hypothetical protein